LLSRPREGLTVFRSRPRRQNVLVYKADFRGVKRRKSYARPREITSTTLFREGRLSSAVHSILSILMSSIPETPASFEAALAELEEIVASMEGGQLPLQESLAAYKRGAELLAYCQAALKDAEQQVLILEKGVLKTFKPEGNADA
jgi:exodeoxyribonuclease VII small subunit